MSRYIPWTHAGHLARMPRDRHKAPKCDNPLRRLGREMARLAVPFVTGVLPPGWPTNGRGDRLNPAKYPQRLARRIARQRRRDGRVPSSHGSLPGVRS